MVFWEDVEPNLAPRLGDAVAKAYDVFGKYKLSGTIVHCDCSVCMSADVARQLSSLPLSEINASLLAEYTNSAHGYDTETIEPEFKHFLPRYLDWIANCDPPSHIGLETCLVRLQGYRERWPKAACYRDAVPAWKLHLPAAVRSCPLIEACELYGARQARHRAHAKTCPHSESEGNCRR